MRTWSLQIIDGVSRRQIERESAQIVMLGVSISSPQSITVNEAVVDVRISVLAVVDLFKDYATFFVNGSSPSRNYMSDKIRVL